MGSLENPKKILMKFSDDSDATKFFEAEALKERLFFAVDVDDNNKLTGQYRFSDGKGKILKGNLDIKTLKFLEKNWGKIQNSELKEQIFQALMNPIRPGRLDTEEFVEQVKKSLDQMLDCSPLPNTSIVARVDTAKLPEPGRRVAKVEAHHAPPKVADNSAIKANDAQNAITQHPHFSPSSPFMKSDEIDVHKSANTFKEFKKQFKEIKQEESYEEELLRENPSLNR